jgi:N-acetyl-gamma-glutamyl-phosphate reductase
MITAGIVGGSGFVGQSILRLLLKHPGVKIGPVVSENHAGMKVSDVAPDIVSDMTFSPMDIRALNACDVVFLAVPHGKAAPLAKDLTCKVIDMTADHRLSKTYGLPEINKQEIAGADLIANPGCYATASILSAYPLKEHIKYAVFDCISGYSGGGVNNAYDYQENMIAYKLTDHFHIKEMSKVLGFDLSFTPHVVNAFAGIMCTAHIQLDGPMEADAVKATYAKYYEGSNTMVADGIPCTKEVVGTPICKIGGFAQEKPDRIVIVSVIDNLLKGAASQAVENMNIMFGLGQKEGLQ